MKSESYHTVVLENEETLEGQVINMARAKYLLQTENLCLRLSEKDIRSVDGQTDISRILGVLEDEVFETGYFHEVHKDGSGTDTTWTVETHKGTEAMTHKSFVLGSDPPLTEELRGQLRKVLENLEYWDKWGRILPLAVEEETESGWKYKVSFNCPVFPGEPIELIEKKTWPWWSRKEGEEWVRSHYIRPSANVLATIVIQLPEEGSFSKFEPEPFWKMCLNGRETAGWRRYLTPEGILGPVVRYRLGG